MNTEGSGYLVLKYTGRPLQLPDRSGRPGTPPALLRNITTFSGANATRAAAVRSGLSPPQVTRQRSNLEAIMQSTAKNIYARSEKAVRSAVDEVHKRAAEIRETGPPSLPPRPAARGGYGALYGRVKALEERNRQLAKLLEGAVGELWDCQRLAADRKAVNSAGGEGVGSDVEQLSMAVAKVQFVQVYLADPELPLPEADPQPQHEHVADAGSDNIHGTGGKPESGRSAADNQLAGFHTTQGASEERLAASAGTSAAQQSLESGAQIRELADPSTFEDGGEEPPHPTSNTEQPVSSSISSPRDIERTKTLSEDDDAGTKPRPTAGVSDAATNPTASRPALAESSYSWMLGTEKQPFETSATSLPEQSRKKSSLFGDGGETQGASNERGEKRGTTARERDREMAAPEAAEDDAFDLSTLRRSRGHG